MRKAVVIGGGLLLCLVGVIVFAQLFGSGILFPVTVQVRVFAWTNVGGILPNVTVNINPGNLTVVTILADWNNYPIVSLRTNTSYSVTASWQQAWPLTKTITIGNLEPDTPNCVILVQVDTAQMKISFIDFIPWY